jgi:integrase
MKMKGKVAVATIRRSLKLLEAFYDFCLADRLITDKPNFSKIEGRLPQSPKAPRQPSTPHWNGDSYDPDELYQLFGAAASTSCAGSSQIRWPARDFAIVGFLGVVGLRPGELVDAQVSWINEGTGWGSFDSSEPTLFLNVQTRPGRLNIPLSPELVRTHRKWMDERCELLGTPLPNEPLFVSSYGEGLTTRRLREILRVLNSEAGLRDRPPSTLRRTVQRMHVEAGLSRAEIQLLMGYRRPPR